MRYQKSTYISQLSLIRSFVSTIKFIFLLFKRWHFNLPCIHLRELGIHLEGLGIEEHQQSPSCVLPFGQFHRDPCCLYPGIFRRSPSFDNQCR